MADLIIPAQVTDRLGPDVDVDAGQLSALIADASALVRQAASGQLDLVDHTTPTPDVIVPVVVAAVRRALFNPNGVRSEALGAYRYDGAPSEGIFLTRDELRTVRKHAGVLAAGTMDLNVNLPLRASTVGSEFDEQWVESL